MIGSGELRRGDREEETIRLAQLGRIETIMNHKKQINLDNLFVLQKHQLDGLPTPRIFLIEGAPGGGKSTLALHICHQWAQYASFMERFEVVVLVYLRDQAIQKATSLADILPARTSKMSQTVISQIQASDGNNVLFVLDGWDEFPYHLQKFKHSFVSKLIRQPQKLSLHQSTVLITSRPVSSGNLLHIVNRRVEIMGFTQCQIREYIEKALDGNSTHIQKLVHHLEEHPVIEGYCYVPLHVAILVHIFLTMKGALPTTLHELFCKLVLCCIVRELDTHESESDTSEVCSLDDLPDDLKSKLSDLCVLAYEGVMQDKVVFYRDDLQQFNLPANLPSLGLLQAVEGLTLLRKSISYNFLHLSVQELLAAYCISQMDSSKQMEVFERMFGSSRFQAVLQYYSGFTKLTNPLIRDFISTYSQRQSSIEDLLPLLHCFYEAQKTSLCKLVASRFTQHIELPSLSPVDYLAIGYFITSLLSLTSSNIQLRIKEVDHTRSNFKLLLLELLKYPIKSSADEATFKRKLELEFCSSNFNGTETELIPPLLEKSTVLSKLSLKILKAIPFSNAKGICGFAICDIFKSLQHNNSLVHFNLSNTRLVATEDTAQALTTMLQVNKTLTHLDLSTNQKFSDSGAYCVCQGLQHNTTLVYLNLSYTEMTDKGAEYIAQAIESNCSLQILDISRNKLSVRGLACIAKVTTLSVKKRHIDHPLLVHE